MKFAYLNPTLFAVDDVPPDTFDHLKNIVELAHTKKQYDDSGTAKISIRGGQQIQLLPNQFGLDITILKLFVEARCKVYLQTLMNTNGNAEEYPYDPCLVSAWTIKQTEGDYQALHSHEAHISGNIYIETPVLDVNSQSSDSQIEFRIPIVRNPATFHFVDQWRFSPMPSKMILFPSHVPHTVYPWKGQGNRTILAWDVKLVRSK